MVKMRIIVAIPIFCLFTLNGLFHNSAFSQPITFQKSYDLGYSENAFSVQQTSDGGYIMCGFQGISIGVSKAFMIKTDSIGQTMWTKTYGGLSDNEFWYVQQTSDGGYIAVGKTTGLYYASDYDIYLVKTDSNGDTLWTKNYEGRNVPNHGDLGYCVQQTFDGGYMVGGYYGDSDTTAGGYLLKTNSNGDSLWAKLYKGNISAGFRSIKQTTDSGFIATGNFLVSGPMPQKIFLVKTNSTGDSLWTKAIGSSQYSESGSSVQQTIDGGYIIGGGVCCPDSGYMGNIYLVKTDSNGDTLWAKQIGGKKNEVGASVIQTNDGGYAVASGTTSYGIGDGRVDVYLVRTDSNGDTLWTKTYGYYGDDGGYSIAKTSDGGFALAGYFQNFDAYLIKTDSAGSTLTSINAPVLSEKQILIFPNPFDIQARVYIEADISNMQNISYIIFDIYGRKMSEMNIGSLRNQDFIISRDNLDAGIYLLQILNKSNVLITLKLVIK